MKTTNPTLDLDAFYPNDKTNITKIEKYDDKIIIKMRSITKSCVCPACHSETSQYHGTYIRKVQDLPILGKNVQLEITTHEYNCMNADCNTNSIAETFEGFLNSYSRMTERCADFIGTLALETSCEGCARICRNLGIHISGDTVIRLLLKRYEALDAPETGEVIGVDDFAYKKRHTYGTIIVNEKTHEPVTLLDGRDGAALREWLKYNKHVKVVTRDRASAYAKVIAEELPDAMQVADRFHLHQNLPDAIKAALNKELPATVMIPHDDVVKEVEPQDKKTGTDVDNFPNYCVKRYQLICQIQKFLADGCSYREIARRLGVGRNTIAKYRSGDPKELSMYGTRQSKLDPFHDFIVQCLTSGRSKSKTVKGIYEKGYAGSVSNAFEYLGRIEDREQKQFEPQPYVRTMTECLTYKMGSHGNEKDDITREGIFRHVWMNTELTPEHKTYMYDNYPHIWELNVCIKEFRNTFQKRNVILLYLFIEKYTGSKIKALRSFAQGLQRDIDAVENAVAYHYSNGFVEGTNSRLKMIKRTMYGRCSKRLLEAKLVYKVSING